MQKFIELILTMGLPASGKTSWTLERVKRGGGKVVHVSRDSIRMGIYGQPQLEASDESLVSSMQISLVRSLLAAKKTVIVDDTNLSLRALELFYALAQEFEGSVKIRIQPFQVPVKTCIERDSLRANPVGEKVILNMSKRYMGGGSELPTVPAKFYETVKPVLPLVQDETLPSAWVVDMDNTLARMVNRGPFEWDKVADDEVVEHVRSLVLDLHAQGHKIVIVTGRDGVARELTELWLQFHEVPFDELFIREEGDNTSDATFKSDIYETQLKGKYKVSGILDDRVRVVDMWRKKGLFVAQVAAGLF